MTANKNIIRERNLDKVKQYMYKHKTGLKADISNQLGLSVVTINSLVNQLIKEEFIFEGELVKQSIGRPAVSLHFNSDKNHFLLLSIEEKKYSKGSELVIMGRIANLVGEISYSKELPFQQVTKEVFLSSLRFFMERDQSISKIGLSIPGKIYKGVVVSSWQGLFNKWNFEEMIKEKVSISVVIENDANLLTVGELINSHIEEQDTTVGIFYPENSMPGITIYHSGAVLTGNHNLAGEAKFLPNLINSQQSASGEILIKNLIDIIEIYNAVIAPKQVIISVDTINKNHILERLKQSMIMEKQLNKPHIIFVEDFDKIMIKGLLWLVLQDTIYRL